ncbi:hypothetical protein MMC14_006128, partial [Varicellaria rhodocarpa]|nr:hypothetical protein [Varicellaria rhodocarpa]
MKNTLHTLSALFLSLLSLSSAFPTISTNHPRTAQPTKFALLVSSSPSPNSTFFLAGYFLSTSSINEYAVLRATRGEHP